MKKPPEQKDTPSGPGKTGDKPIERKTASGERPRKRRKQQRQQQIINLYEHNVFLKKRTDDLHVDTNRLRRRLATDQLEKKPELLENLSSKDMTYLIHELGTHRIELEMQNEELRRTQAELEDVGKKYLDLFNFAPVAYLSLDSHGLIRNINLTGAVMLGVSKKSHLNRPFSRFIKTDQDRDVFSAHLATLLKSRTKEMCEVWLEGKNGKKYFTQIQSMISETEHDAGGVIRMAISDITARKTIEERLAYLASFPQLNPNPILEVNASGDIIFSNVSTQHILRELEIDAKNIAVFLPRDIDIILDELNKKKELSFYREVTVKETQFAETILLSPQFQVARIYGFDITKRVEAEDGLRKSEQRLKFHFENSPLAVVEWDSDFVVTQWSVEAERIFGWKAGEMIGKRIDKLNMIYVEDIPIVNRTVERLISGKERMVVSSNRNYTKSGGVIDCIWYNSILLDDKGGMASVMSLVQDVTERKRSEEKIGHQNEILQGMNKIFEAALKSKSDKELGERCLAVAEAITGSSFGFIGELGADGLLHDLALSDPVWELCKIADKGGERPPGNFHIQGVYGMVLKEDKGFFTNNLEDHPASVGTPEGHPPITSFLGVPLRNQGKAIGMIALGNRENGYRQEDLESIERLAPAIVEAYQRKRAEVEIQRHSEELRIANEELVRFNRVAIGRELRMVQLKKEVNELCKKAGVQERYALDFERNEPS